MLFPGSAETHPSPACAGGVGAAFALAVGMMENKLAYFVRYQMLFRYQDIPLKPERTRLYQHRNQYGFVKVG